MKKNYTFFFFVLISLYSYAQNFQYLGSYSANGTPDYLESLGKKNSVITSIFNFFTFNKLSNNSLIKDHFLFSEILSPSKLF
ncbi:hypothetical protein ACFSTE_21270 [Aquimarina hainanensis]|uniref:Uncharacterized protein n=1 Tax=Aquimarina hainanensis TaxID=1578017 RepID=A0ABW5NDR0_9FLAO